MAIAPETRSGLNHLAEEAGLRRDRVVELGIRLREEALRAKIRPHEDILEDLKDLCAAAEEVQIALTSHAKRGRWLRGPGRTGALRHSGRPSVDGQGDRGGSRVQNAD